MKKTLKVVTFCFLYSLSVAANTFTDYENWHGAQWIGGNADAIPFHSQYLPVFQLSFSLQLSQECKSAGIIYGANDLRLTDSRKNIYGICNGADSSYIELQFRHDSLHVIRKGYSPKDGKGKLLQSFILPQNIDMTVPHNIVVNSNAGITAIFLDRAEIGKLNVSPTAGGGDYTAFPVVGDVGYDVKGGTVTLKDFEVRNFRSPHNVLAKCKFGEIKGFKITRLPGVGTTALRCRFHVKSKKIKRASIQATARGIYDLYLNKSLIISEKFLNPGASQYNKSHYYQTYDITDLLRKGDNMLGASLGEGWWSGALSYEPGNWNWFGDRQSLLCRLAIEYEDGTKDEIIGSPHDWEYSTDGPIRYGSLFQGEIYDASRSLFDGGKWRKAQIVPLAGVITDEANEGWPLANDYSLLTLLHDNDAGVQVFDTIEARSVREIGTKQYIYDMGYNHAGVPSITFRNLEKGQAVTIRYAEVLYPEHHAYKGRWGHPMMENLRAAMVQDIYIASGDSAETYTPRTTYHGYRYMELTGIERPLPLSDVSSLVLSSVQHFTSGFECSDTLVNKLVDNIRHSTLSNAFSIPTDCPQRNERMGWSGDISVFATAMSYLFDAQAFLGRHTRALRDTRESNGAYSPIAPFGGGFGGPLWQSAGIILPWQLYLQYGDTICLRDNYTAMKEYIAMVTADYINRDDGHFQGTGTWVDLGDWLGPQCRQNEEPLLFDSYLIYELNLMERIANVLDEPEDAAWYATEREKRIQFINDTYVDPAKALIVGQGFGEQATSWAGPLGGQPTGANITAHTSYAVPLALDIFNKTNKPLMAERLHELVTNESMGDDGKLYAPYSLMTGFIGTPWILYALSDNGYAADAYSVLLQRSYPSWLFPVELGATSIWERLNSMTRENGFGTHNSMNSFNHYAFGCVYDWLIQRCAGITPDPDSPGFKHFNISPVVDPTGRMTFARGWYDTRHGRIESNWQIKNGTVYYEFIIPAHTTATLILPDGVRTLTAGKYNCVPASLESVDKSYGGDITQETIRAALGGDCERSRINH